MLKNLCNLQFQKIKRRNNLLYAYLLSITLLLLIIYIMREKENETFDDHNANKDDSIEKILFSKVKILCLINSSRKQLFNRTIHVHATWAKRCNKHVFLTYDENINLPLLELKNPGNNERIPETRSKLWDKWRAALTWAYENEIDNYDFFLRADDDSYFIMENLRFMLLPYDPDKALIFGERFKLFVREGYMSGGAGVVFTRGALRKLAHAFYKPEICPEVTEGDDDIEIGACAQNLGITNIDTRDEKGRHKMLAWSVEDHFIKGLNNDQMNYLYYSYNNEADTSACCAEYMISFHYVYQEMMYAFEFLIYKAKLIGNIDNLLQNESVKVKNMTLLKRLTQSSLALSSSILNLTK